MAEYASKTASATNASKSSTSSAYTNLNAEGHPAYYVKGSSAAKSVIQWNKNQGYSKSYIQKMQRKVGTADDGDIGTNTINAIRDYQVKNGLGIDGKWGKECATHANLPREYANGKKETFQDNKQQDNKQQDNKKEDKKDTGTSGGKPLPKRNWMASNFTPDLQELKDGADYEGTDVSKIGNAAKFVANNCMASSPLGQCTRGTALFMQLASYARGEAKRTYKSACRACDFGNGSSNGNISASVSSSFAETRESGSVSPNSTFDSKITDHLKSNGDYVTFQYENVNKSSFHIVFKVGSKYYSDFAQGTPCGIGTKNGTNKFWNIRYYNH